MTRAECDGQPSPELFGEAVREAVFQYALHGEHPSPVHVQSIMNLIRRQLAPVWPTLARPERGDWGGAGNGGGEEGEEEPGDKSPIRRCLDVLASVGDLQHVGSGYWLPTPIRFVRLDDGPNATALLIGGAPLRQLRSDGYVSVSSCGHVRALPLRIIPASLRDDDNAWQSVDDWLGSPAEPLTSWAARKLRRAADELSPSHPELGPFEIYCPEAHPREPQFFRWVSSRLHQPSAERLYLCRTVPQGASGPRRYWLGRLTSRESAARPLLEYPVSGRDVRRLQYALDALASAPTRGAVKYQPESAEVTLYSYLPDSEFRLLTAVGEERSAKPGRLPMVYRIARSVAEPVLNRIGGLGIQWY